MPDGPDGRTAHRWWRTGVESVAASENARQRVRARRLPIPRVKGGWLMHRRIKPKWIISYTPRKIFIGQDA